MFRPSPFDRRWCRGLALALTLAVIPSACDKRVGLAKIQVPAGGLQLHYDLTPGAVYDGHIRHGEATQSDFGRVNQAVECDVHLVVMGPDSQRGGSWLQATFANVKLDLKVAENAVISLNELTATATRQVQGMKVDFNVDTHGKILHMPSVPEGIDPQVGAIIEQVLDTLELGFMVVPDRSLKAGESWADEQKIGREGKLGRYRIGKITTTLDGLFRDAERKEDLAKLAISLQRKEVITTKGGSHENEYKGKTVALFSTSGNYLASVDGEVNKFDPGAGTTFTKVRVEWRKTSPGKPGATRAAATAATAGGGDAQSIADPCDPDYVGPEECPGAATTAAGPEDTPPAPAAADTSGGG